jgi:hypothetical protein
MRKTAILFTVFVFASLAAHAATTTPPRLPVDYLSLNIAAHGVMVLLWRTTD